MIKNGHLFDVYFYIICDSLGEKIEGRTERSEGDGVENTYYFFSFAVKIISDL